MSLYGSEVIRRNHAVSICIAHQTSAWITRVTEIRLYGSIVIRRDSTAAVRIAGQPHNIAEVSLHGSIIIR